MFVRNEITRFGENAGKIWSVLNEKNEPIREEDLMRLTHLYGKEFYAAIGWLARENKIRREEGGYMLGETNLTPEIGSIAGRVWKILDIWGEADLDTIKRLAGTEEKNVFAAIGWLAREEKIEVDETQTYRLK